MRWAFRTFSCVGLLFVGYLVGAFHVGAPALLQADPSAEPLPNALRDRLRDTNRVLSETMQVLQEEKRYVPAIQGLNAFATSVGGVDAIADLEAGDGVDPETFAGLYAGQALAEVAEHMGRNAEGRITYKNKVVRMYTASRLKQHFIARSVFSPAGTGPTIPRETAAAKKASAESPKKSKAKDE